MHARILLMTLLFTTNIYSTSMVYNFRTAQATRPPVLNKETERNSSIVSLLFNQHQKELDGTHENFCGAFGSYIHTFDRYYFRVDAACANITESLKDKKIFSGTEVDDILLSFGCNFFKRQKTAITVSGLIGIPTHAISNLENASFGFNQAAIGVQFDAINMLTKTTSIICGCRFFYFIPRTIKLDIGPKFKFSYGNIGDLLVGSKTVWTPKHATEIGYSFRSIFDIEIPNQFNIFGVTKFKGSGIYAIYRYKFPANNMQHRLLFNISYGFQHHPTQVGIKYIVTTWAAWSVSF